MGEVPRLSKLSFPRLFSLRESPGSPATRGREGALVDHGSSPPPVPGLVGGVGAFDYFPPCQNPRSSAAGLAILRPRGGCGPGFLSSLVRTRWGSRSFIYLFIYLVIYLFIYLFIFSSVLSGGPRHPEGERRLWSRRLSRLPGPYSLGGLGAFFSFFSFVFLLARTLGPQRRASSSRGREEAAVTASLFSVHWSPVSCTVRYFFFLALLHP